MCGRYTITTEPDLLETRFEISLAGTKFLPRFNVAPSQDAPVVINQETKSLKMMKWGLVPIWAKDPAIGYKMINARAETVTQKPSFKKSFQSKRCLVVSDGFYEWRKIDSRTKIPMRIVLRTREPFAFAGLYDEWKKPDGNTLQSFTIVTTTANSILKSIHERMPVILDRENEDDWLDPDLKDPFQLVPLLKSFPSEKMEAYHVSTLVNSPTNDSSECIKPAGVSPVELL